MNEECAMEEAASSSGRHGNDRRLAAVERDVAVIRSNYSTKEDLVKLESKVQDRLSRLDNNLSEMENRLIRWFFATSVSLAAVAFSAGKFL